MTIAFPVALHGTEAEIEKQMIAAGRAWADDLRKGVPLRSLESREVPPGARIYCSEVSTLRPGQPEWRVYGLLVLRTEARTTLTGQQRDQARAALEAALLQFPAGVLWLNVALPEPNTLIILQHRVEALLDNWDILATLSYIDAQLRPQSLEAVIEYHYKPFFDIWLDDPETGPIARRLRVAMETALAAPEDDTRQRLIAAIRSLATRLPRIEDPHRFRDREWVERQLAAVRPAEYESAKTGASLAAVVYDMHRRGERDAKA